MLGKWQGQADIPLNSKGVEEAKMVAEKLYEKHPDITIIYSSDLIRAIDTARETQHIFRLPLQTFPALREYKAGEAEGLTTEEVISRFVLSLNLIQMKKLQYLPTGGCIKILIANLLDLESIEEVSTPNGCFYELIYEFKESESHLFLKKT